MPDNESVRFNDRPHTPWNKGKLIGPKPPLRPKHVWSIRTRLMIEGRARDLAMFNLAIDSKLRGCDVVALKVEDVAPNCYTVERATVRAEKDPTTSQVRADRADAASGRRLLASVRQEARRVSILRPPARRPLHDDTPVRAPRGRMDWRHRARSEVVRYAFIETDESYPDLPAHWKPSRRPAPARPYETRARSATLASRPMKQVDV
jgi:hypothetical protein